MDSTRDTTVETEGVAAGYPSLCEMRAEHRALLREFHESHQGRESDPLHEVDPFAERVKRFLARGGATGERLGSDDDRATARGLLDYWVSVLTRFDYTLTADLARHVPHGEVDLTAADCPYDRMDSSGSADALWFGRDQAAAVTEALKRLEEHHLVVLLGEAGGDRFSLARTGLLPALQGDRPSLKGDILTGSERWRYLPPVTPGSDPLRALEDLVRAAAPEGADLSRPEVPAGGQVRALGDAVRRRVDRLRGAKGPFAVNPRQLGEQLRATGPTPAVLVVDHFEHLFTQYAGGRDRELFVGNLAHLVRGTRPEFYLVLIARGASDRQLRRLSLFRPPHEPDRVVVRVPPYTADQLRQIIEEPARRVGLTIEPLVVDGLVRDLQGDPAAMPLLEFTLAKLWDRRSGPKRNTVSYGDYRALGSGRQALRNTAEEFYEGLSDFERGAARRVLLKIVRPAPAPQLFTTRTVPRSELIEPGEPEVVQRMLEARLLYAVRGRVGEGEAVALADESLVHYWPELRNWLDDEAYRQRSASLRLWAIAVTVLCLLALVLAAGVESFRREAVAQRREAETQKGKAVEQAHLARHRLAGEAVLKGMIALNQGDPGGSLPEFAKALREEPDDDLYRDHTGYHEARLGAALRQLPRLVQLKPAAGGRFRTMALNPKGRLAVAATREGSAQVWDVHTNELRRTLDHGAEVKHVALSPDDKYVVTAGLAPAGAKTPGLALIWAATGSDGPVGRLEHARPINHVEFNGDGRLLLTASGREGEDGEALVWDVSTPAQPQPKYTLKHGGAVLHAVFLPKDDRYVVTAGGGPPGDGNSGLVGGLVGGAGGRRGDGNSGRVQLWRLDAPGGPEGSLLTPERGDRVNRPAVDPGGRLPQEPGRVDPLRGVVNRVAVDPGGRLLAAASGGEDIEETGEVRVWSLERDETGRLVGKLIRALPHRSGVSDVAFGPAGDLLATASHDGTVRMWGADGGREPIQTFRHSSSVRRLAFSPDGRYLATGSRDKSVRVWELATGQPLVPPMRHCETVSEVAFDPNLERLVTVSPEAVRVWELASSNPAPHALGARGKVVRVAGSGDGRVLITYDDQSPGRVDVWDAATGVAVRTLYAGGPVDAAALTPDGRVAVTVGNAGALQVWDLDTGERRAKLTVNDLKDAAVNHVAVSANGRRVVISGGKITRIDTETGGRARVWDVTAGQPAKGDMAHKNGVIHASFGPDADGPYVITASADDTAEVWDAESGAKLTKKPIRHTADIAHAALYRARDGRLFAVTSGYDLHVVVWELRPDGGELEPVYKWMLPKHDSRPTAAAVGRDDRLVTATQDGSAYVWHLPIRVDGDRVREEESRPELITVLKAGGSVQHVALRPDGRVVTASARSLRGEQGRADQQRLIQARVWDVGPLGVPRDRLQKYVDLLAARFLPENRLTESPDGDVAPPLSALPQRWVDVRDWYPKDIPAAEPRATAEQAARERELAGEWYAARWHLTRLIGAKPDPSLHARLAEAHLRLHEWGEAERQFEQALGVAGKSPATPHGEVGRLWTRLAQTRVEQGKWSEAEADLKRAVELIPGSVLTWSKLAEAHLAVAEQHRAAGRQAEHDKEMMEYRELCARVLDRFSSPSVSADTANQAAWVCCIAPNPDLDFIRVVALAGLADRKEPRTYEYLNTYGAALYRAGKYEEAVAKLDEARAAYRTRQPADREQGGPAEEKARSVSMIDGTPWDWLFLAMTYKRLGRDKEAREWLDRSTFIIRRDYEDSRDDSDTLFVWNKKEIQLIRDEAEALINARK